MFNITYTQFKNAVYLLHSAATKHNNVEMFVFAKNRELVVAYINSTPNWQDHVTKSQIDTCLYCKDLEEKII